MRQEKRTACWFRCAQWVQLGQEQAGRLPGCCSGGDAVWLGGRTVVFQKQPPGGIPGQRWHADPDAHTCAGHLATK